VDLRLIGAFATGVAVFSGLMALLPDAQRPSFELRARLRTWYRARLAAAGEQLAQARLELSPRGYLLLSVIAPLVLALVGLVLSPAMGLIGALLGLLVPRWYLRWLVGTEARAADDDAPRVLRAMVHRAQAGGTYPDLFAAAGEAARHRWVRADFEELLSRYFAAEPPPEAISAIRRRQAGRNLALVFDALFVLTRTHQPVSAAAELLAQIGEAASTNQAIARQAAAESRGLRIQALILAIVIPLLFVYLLLVNPELVAPVTDTALGRFVLLPAAALLEVAGIWLSLRVARLEA